MPNSLVTVEEVRAHLGDPQWIFIDCRFDLADTAAGRAAYLAGHIPGAVYAHLDDDLSGPPVTDNGRHPLPTPAALTRLFGKLGIDGQCQVVVYDAHNGVFASRLWWMLRYMGHKATAVLDGGWAAWEAAGMSSRSGEETNSPRVFLGEPRRDWLVRLEDVSEQPMLIDSREGPRYRGEEEPLDPQPGHIPGAVNFHFSEVWGADGRYLPADQIRRKMIALLGETPVENAVFYCGSGVSACVNLLALVYAGLGDGRLYVGSWSEWSRDPARPVATGSENS
jgi:thiosulfate/3-mercaptopyruvate sulfurtransferase